MLLAINPAEVLRRSRDTVRMNDLATFHRSIGYQMSNGSSWNTSTVCSEGTRCLSATNSRESNGSGWIPINLSSYISSLSVDPLQDEDDISISTGVSETSRSTINDIAYEFMYSDPAYEIRCYLESSNNWQKLRNDGGDDNGTLTEPGMFEVGNNLTLL